MAEDHKKYIKRGNSCSKGPQRNSSPGNSHFGPQLPWGLVGLVISATTYRGDWFDYCSHFSPPGTLGTGNWRDSNLSAPRPQVPWGREGLSPFSPQVPCELAGPSPFGTFWTGGTQSCRPPGTLWTGGTQSCQPPGTLWTGGPQFFQPPGWTLRTGGTHSFLVLVDPAANSYAVGLVGSKRSISDPLFIRRDVSGYLPYRQSDRVCSFCFVFVLFLGAFDTPVYRAGESQFKTASCPARAF